MCFFRYQELVEWSCESFAVQSDRRERESPPYLLLSSGRMKSSAERKLENKFTYAHS